MANESLLFEEMLDDYLPATQEYGEVVKGTVIRLDNDYAYVDISNKKEGRISLHEIEGLQINSEIEAQIIKIDEEYIILSHNALERKKAFEKLSIGDILKGNIVKQNKFGYTIKSGALSLFLPFSLSAIKKGSNVIGKEYEVMVKSKNGKKVLVSRVDLLDKVSKEFFEKYNVGDVVEGKVIKLLDFGAVISLGSMNGFIHISELSWKNVNDIKEIIKIGDVKEFKIIEINQEDKNVKLSLKQLQENPWNTMKEKYHIGDVVEGIVKEIFNFGILVTLEENEEAFMHISDITCRKISDINSIYKVGDKIVAKIININEEKERIQISARVLLEEILDNLADKYEVGQIHKGRVINIQDYGIFLEMEDKVEVFIHRNEFSWERENLEFNVDDIVEFKLTKVDTEEKKISASIRELTKSPWELAIEDFEIGDTLEVHISDIIEAGALVPLTENFKALIPKKELAVQYVEKTEDIVNVGDVVNAVIIEINPQKRSVILSIKEANSQAEAE